MCLVSCHDLSRFNCSVVQLLSHSQLEAATSPQDIIDLTDGIDGVTSVNSMSDEILELMDDGSWRIV